MQELFDAFHESFAQQLRNEDPEQVMQLSDYDEVADAVVARLLADADDGAEADPADAAGAGAQLADRVDIDGVGALADVMGHV